MIASEWKRSTLASEVRNRVEIEKLKMRIGALKTDLENTQQNLLMVRSPYEGVVISMDQRTAGSFVQQGQVLCQLAPKGSKPRARMILNEAGLPKLAVAQRVRYFFEAFPYQRYGTITGKVDWISPSAVTTTEGSRFVALGSLDRYEISSRSRTSSASARWNEGRRAHHCR